ncbi:hypothetical protein [Sedimenticola hydrogenitrophicus]|uniref:hypothetical protein n=1 Tax=Sedimenticola hydrogenitrophicus TaxID=2967975 RepID=UPI0021A7C845|nr:hypothetical protein [Sedimenticola hydrogenitrophicus]
MNGHVYKPVVHYSGSVSKYLDITAQMPWLYIIAAQKQKVVYVGETYDLGGLIVRLGRHFGPYSTSTLRQNAQKLAGIQRLTAPYFVVAAKLPGSEDDFGFDGETKKVRQLFEALISQLLTEQYLALDPNWNIVSSFVPPSIKIPPGVEQACESIYKCFMQGYNTFEQLSKASPLNMMLLDIDDQESDREASVNDGKIIEEIEVLLFEWLLDTLKECYSEKWWTDGIPQRIRIQCQSRREEEGARENLPPEAYMTLIDFKEVVKNNWNLCGDLMEQVSEESGKERATAWIVKLNELRKLWAHPIKQIFVERDPSNAVYLRKKKKRLLEAIK